MNDIKVYNVIFPIWILIIFPPFVFAALIGNFIIDSLVLVGCYYWYKKSAPSLKPFYKKHILKVWIFGFLADIIGTVVLMAVSFFEVFGSLPYEIAIAVDYNPLSDPLAFLIVIFAMLISAAFIFILNYLFTFRKTIEDKKTRIKVSVTIALLTIPWTFLIPTDWFLR